MPRTRVSVRSLRSRWNRAFAVLFIVVLLGGVASFVGSRMLVGNFRHAAEQIEKESTFLSRLQAEILSHAIVLAGVDFSQAPALERAVRASFEHGIATSDIPDSRQALQQAFDRWQAMVAGVGPLDDPAPIGQRGLAVGVPEVSASLDRAAEAGLAHLRADLAAGRWAERRGIVALVALGLVVSVLMIRFARRLTAEVLRPVGMLRDSANRLAAGELDHRVDCGRTDELGDLASSFNAMADAIAGSQRSLTREADHDSLTGLANRGAFRARLDVALARPERRAGTQAVLFVDLDDFKDVNDTLGHAAGDELLCVVAARLLEAVRPGDLVARLGGDEFAVLLDGVPGPDMAFAVAERAVAALAAPVEITGTRLHVGASIGLAMRQDDSDSDGLLHQADVAMYTAKGRGKNRVDRYDPALNDGDRPTPEAPAVCPWPFLPFFPADTDRTATLP